MKRTLIVLVGLLCAGIFANGALAGAQTATDPLGGYIEVCKAPSTTLTGNFAFTVKDAFGTTTSVTLPISSTVTSCTSPIAVDTGSATVTELGSLSGLGSNGTVSSTPTTSYTTATVAALGPTGSQTCGTTAFTCSTTVPASPNGTANVVTVTFTDTLVDGYVEVCKNIVSGSGLTGTWSFTLTGGNGFSQIVSGVAPATCSDAIPVPAGVLKVQETGDLAENVTAITATQDGESVVLGPDAGPAADLPSATVVTSVAPSTSSSNQTLVSMTNDSVTLKICKVADGGLTPSSKPAYTFAYASTGNAGPTPSGSVTLGSGTAAAPFCTTLGPFRAGTTVTVTETPNVGEKVGSITVSPTSPQGGQPASETTVVPGSLSLPNQTVSVILGAGETDVTFENIAALDGSLKICKYSTGTPPVTGSFSFTVTPVTGTGTATTVSVPVGGCTVVGNYPYSQELSIAETAITGTAVSTITVSPSPDVEVLENPAANTACPLPAGTGLVNTGMPSSSNLNTAARSIDTTISECATTEVDVTNADPPITSGGGTTSSTGGTTSSTGGTTSSGGGGGGGGGGSSSGGSPSVTSPTGSTAAVSPTPISIPIGIGSVTGTGKTSGTSGTSNTANAVKLAADKKALATLEARLKTEEATWNTAAGANNALAWHIAQLRARVTTLEQKYAKVTAASVQATIKAEIAKIQGDLPMLQLKYGKAVSANHALAKEIAANKTSQAKLVVEIAGLE